MNANHKIEQLAAQLENIVDSEVRDALAKHGSGWEELKCLRFDIERYYQNALEIFEDSKKNGFTANTIECEGYLRAMTLAKSLIETQINQ